MVARSRYNQLTVERKIHFFRVDAGNNDDGTPVDYDPSDTLRLIRQLNYQDIDESGPFLETDDGNAVCCWPDAISSPQKLRYVRIRRTGLPSLLQQGLLGPLGIPPDSGLAEEIHVVFFGNNIVGSAFNFFGPRVSNLGYYLSKKSFGSAPTIRIEPLLNMDASSKLSRLRDVSVLKLRVRPSFADFISRYDADLGSAIDGLHRVGQSEVIELVLRPRPYSKSKLTQNILNTVRSIVGLSSVGLGGLREEALKIEVTGFDQEARRDIVVDVLSDKLVTTKRMMKQDARSRAVTNDSAYSAIAEAYDELRSELTVASAVRS